MDHNNLTITGRLTKDPDLKAVGGDTSVTKLSVASNESYKKDGEWVNKPLFIDVDVWGAAGERCVEKLVKGSRVLISGRLQFRTYEDKDGNKRSAYSVRADNYGGVLFLDPKPASDESGQTEEKIPF